MMKRTLLALACLLLPLIAAPTYAAAPAVSISVSPATGNAPYPATLTWSATGATSCTASDGWTGTQAVSGSKQVTITAAIKYTLTCFASDGQVTITWTPPTTNTDGSTLTDLAGTNLYRGTTAANLTKFKSTGVGITSWVDAGLASGTYLYAATAVNAASLESARSVTSSAVVVGSSASQSATAAVQTIPNPPSGLTTVAATAYEIRPTNGVLVASRIGVIPLRFPCQTDTRTVANVKYNRVDPGSIDLVNWPAVLPPVDTFARCAGG